MVETVRVRMRIMPAPHSLGRTSAACMVAVFGLASVVAAQPAERSGKDVVDQVCAKCHGSGVNGAPKIGDLAAWIPRVKQGLNPLVRSAITGHGGMPARGGAASLTDAEIRGAVVYMVNPATAAAPPDRPQRAMPGENVRIVGDTTIYFGVVAADAMRGSKDYPASIYGAAPAGPNQYFVNVALFDADSGRRVSDAKVSARVSTAATSGRETALKSLAVPNAPAYGDYLPMPGGGPFQVTLHVRRPDRADTLETRFEYTP